MLCENILVPPHRMIRSYFLSPILINCMVRQTKKLDMYYYTQLINPHLYSTYVERNIYVTPKWLKIYHKFINWKLFSKFQPTYNIYKFCNYPCWVDKFVWNIIARHHDLHKWFIIKHFSLMDASLLCRYQYLDNNFIMSNLQYLDFDLILRYQYLRLDT